MIHSFKKAKVGFFGMGRSNLAVLDFLVRNGMNLEITVRADKDMHNFPSFPVKAVYSGKRAYEDINEDILFLSPSVRRDKPELKSAAERGVLLSSDAELFFSETKLPPIAVTGSDGKSSTTYLIASAMRRAGYNAYPAGNFGLPLSSFLSGSEIPVAELSSFQLMNSSFKTKRAVITNITPNHLDWHKSLAEYIEAKLCIARDTEGLIIDFDSRILREAVSGYDIFAAVSKEHSYQELKKLIPSENYITLRGNTVLLDGEPYFSLSHAKRREDYNIKNFMLASGALIGEASGEAIEEAVGDFGGLPHRKETVAKIGGITYINSSIDSTPERTLNTLKSMKGDVAVIIGGKGKGLPSYALARELPNLTVGACLMGEVGHELYELLMDRHDYKTVFADNMQNAVKAASGFLKNGGTVLLSPAATSFDKYENFEKRGEDFKKVILENKE